MVYRTRNSYATLDTLLLNLSASLIQLIGKIVYAGALHSEL